MYFYILDHPFQEQFTWLLDSISETLETAYKGTIDVPDIMSQISHRLDTYVSEVSDRFENYDEVPKDDILNQLKTSGDTLPAEDLEHLLHQSTTASQPMRYALERFVNALSDKKLPRTIFRYLTNPEIGSGDIARAGDVNFPVILSPLPWRIATDIYDRIRRISQRVPIDDPEQSGFDDSIQEDYERNFLVQLGEEYDEVSSTTASGTHTPSWKKQFDHSFGKKAPEDDADHDGDNSNSQGGSKQQGNEQQGNQQQQQQPTVPDDTSYTPDPILSFQMRDFIAHIQGLAAMEMRLDHMTRFSRTDEAAQLLTKWQVRNDDARTFERNLRLGKMYVVTFTRANRKPIFNPVN